MSRAKVAAKPMTDNVAQFVDIEEEPAVSPGAVYTKFMPIGPPSLSPTDELKQFELLTGGTSAASARVISTHYSSQSLLLSQTKTLTLYNAAP
jgi:hypothetical protein